MMPPMKRRNFLQSAGLGVAAATLFHVGGRAAETAKVRHAVIGLGGHGMGHVREFSANPRCELRFVCDVDSQRLESAAKESGAAPVEDFRRILEKKDVDSVCIATPDHWHTPLALMALEAGKHVYLEKPCIHTVQEGKALMDAVKKSGKCVQHGTQSRSSRGIIDAVAFLREGKMGKIRLAKAINHQMREALPDVPDSNPPSFLNYDLWLGPAPERPFNKARSHYNWRWQWDYGCGDIGNDGIHQVDQARWGLGVALPNAVSASGGQLFYRDIHETPDTQIVTYEYDDAYLVYEMRLWTDYPMEGHDNGVVFYGDLGTVQIGRKGCFAHFKNGETERIGDGADFPANIANYLECVQADAPENLLAPIEEGVYSGVLCHLGNIATRVGARLKVDKENWSTDNEAANGLLSKTYRKPFVV